MSFVVKIQQETTLAQVSELSGWVNIVLVRERKKNLAVGKRKKKKKNPYTSAHQPCQSTFSSTAAAGARFRLTSAGTRLSTASPITKRLIREMRTAHACLSFTSRSDDSGKKARIQMNVLCL